MENRPRPESADPTLVEVIRQYQLDLLHFHARADAVGVRVRPFEEYAVLFADVQQRDLFDVVALEAGQPRLLVVRV